MSERNEAALRAEIARQDAELAHALEALRAFPADSELAIAVEWLETFDQAALPSTGGVHQLNGFVRC